VATVTIAALGGPLPAVGTALAELVKRAQARYDANAPTRDLRRQVTAEIRQWAESEKFSPEAVKLGLTLAAETVAQFGVDHEAIAALQFDPDATSRRVLKAAKAKDRYWGTEDHYEVAARGIGVTYLALIQQLQASEPVLLPAIQALRGSIDDYATRVEAMAHSVQETLADLAEALMAAGTVAEVMSYLQCRVADWDVSVWHPDQQLPSAVERQLLVRTADGETSQSPQEMTAEEALAGQRILVVLGGPGSGKTWLARRYAREAAQAALSRLEDGADLNEVELPLFTTWDQWTKTAGGTRQSLVAASFASGLGHSDPEASDTIDRLQRTFLQPDTQVLLVVDSLDEAADLAGQAARLRELSSLHGWRVVVTSRQAAWAATYRGEGDRGGGRRVAELETLNYPDDVVAFVQAWFADNPSRGAALLKQIGARDDLVRVAVVPLILTFYCLLTEEPADSDRPLPARRRDLYRRLVRRLLRARWVTNAPGSDTAPDLDYCETLLADWAWHAVRYRITPTGVGDWGDSFTQPIPPREAERRSIDHVAPKVIEDDEGQVTRRFVHRTLLEHFVAEYLATLDADQAEQVIIPHLWFDPDWDVAVPAAIVAHNERQRGALLEKLQVYAVQPGTDPARQAASREYDAVLLALARESEPGDWAPAHAQLLHQCRARNATRQCDLVARSAHWTDSNQVVRTSLLDVLATTNSGYYVADVADLVGFLMALSPSAAERANARATVLNALPSTAAEAHSELVGALSALVPTDAERAAARAALLNAMTASKSSWQTIALAMALPALDPSDADRAAARTMLINAREGAETSGHLYSLIRTLSALDPTDVERRAARTALLDALFSAPDPGAEDYLMNLLPELGPTDAERAAARTALINALPSTHSIFGDVGPLPALVTTDAERAEVRAALLNALRTHPEGVHYVSRALSALRPTDADWAEFRAAILNALTIPADPNDVRSLLRTLPALFTTDAQRAAASTALINAVPSAYLWTIDDLVKVLSTLASTDAERAAGGQAVLTVLAALDVSALDAHQAVARVVKALFGLDPTDAHRAEARAAFLNALSDASPHDAHYMVPVLSALDLTDPERANARAALLNAIATADHTQGGTLAEAMLALEPTDLERAKARAALLKTLVASRPWAIPDLVQALTALGATDAERAAARTTVLHALRTSSASDPIGTLVESLSALGPTDAEQGEARTAVLHALWTQPFQVDYLLGVLSTLNPTDTERDEARTTARAAVLNALPHTAPADLRELVVRLDTLLATDADRAEARAAVLDALPTARPDIVLHLVALLRSVSSVQSWLTWLNNGGGG
jgi:hypothetical protein